MNNMPLLMNKVPLLMNKVPLLHHLQFVFRTFSCIDFFLHRIVKNSINVTISS